MVDGASRRRRFRLRGQWRRRRRCVPEAAARRTDICCRRRSTRRFDADFLTAPLEARAQDLASPAGVFLEPVTPRDPTLELAEAARALAVGQEPRREFDVWFSARRRPRAADGGDARAGIRSRRAARCAREARAASSSRWRRGRAHDRDAVPAAFSVLMEERTRDGGAAARSCGNDRDDRPLVDRLSQCWRRAC